ncbi:MAG TPA: hypothetical protein VGR22_06615 [Thermomicrobiales bacterium]|nr:hypothetical protein [Thermomicrobiales bacterium]
MYPQLTLRHPSHHRFGAEAVAAPIDVGGRRSVPEQARDVVILGLNPTLRQTPQSITRIHSLYYSALWRGGDIVAVSDWLVAHWEEHAPPEPERQPDAVSLLGGTGQGEGVRWYQRTSAICGYLPGSHHGCYCIPVADVPPTVPRLLHGGPSAGDRREEPSTVMQQAGPAWQ